MTESSQELRYRTSATIAIPGDIQYYGGLIRWMVEYDEDGEPELVERTVAGCLDEFAALAEATEEEILTFTRQRGVLGVMPSVEIEYQDGETNLDHPPLPGRRTSCGVLYEESPRIYARMALIARHILSVMRYVRTGKKVEPREATLFEVATRYSPQKFRYDNRHAAYQGVQRAVKAWQRASSLSLGLWPSGEDESCDFRLDFGTWEQGHAWDLHTGYHYNNDDNRSLSRWYGLIEDAPISETEKEGMLGPNVNDYPLDHDFLNEIPFSEGRPSPLFNVLVLQLLEAIVLPKDHYFCSRCRRLYHYNEKTKQEGASKPRADRPTCYCNDDCRAKQESDDASERHKRNRERTKRERAKL